MIILNVSSYKTGGTWLQNILRSGMYNFKLLKNSALLSSIDDKMNYIPDLPASYANEENVKKINRAISYESLGCKENILDKIHIYGNSKLIEDLLSELNVKYLLMVRDYRDVIVSRFYHEIASGRFEGEFSTFFELNAKKIFEEAFLYNRFWFNIRNKNQSNVHLINYADLKSNYKIELNKIQEFLGEDVINVNKSLHLFDIKENRQKYTEEWMGAFIDKGGDFYRKGEVGDYQSHFSESQLAQFSSWFKSIESEAVHDKW